MFPGRIKETWFPTGLDGTTEIISSYMGFSSGDKTEGKNNQKHDK